MNSTIGAVYPSSCKFRLDSSTVAVLASTLSHCCCDTNKAAKTKLDKIGQYLSDLIKLKLVQCEDNGANLLMITGQAALVLKTGDERGSGQRWRTIFWTTTFDTGEKQ